MESIERQIIDSYVDGKTVDWIRKRFAPYNTDKIIYDFIMERNKNEK